MGTTTLNRTQAAKRTRMAQIVAIVLLAGGGAAVAIGLRGGGKVELPGQMVLPVVAASSKAAGKQVVMDSGAIGERLNLIANHPVPLEAPPVVAGKEGETSKVITQPPPGELRFLGAVGMGSMSMALVMDGDKQRFVAVGDHVKSGTVQSITDNEITISGGSSPQTVQLASKSSDVVTKVGARGMPRPAVPGAPQQPGVAAINKPGMLQAAPVPTANINGQETAALPDYVRPEMAGRFEQLRNELRDNQQYGGQKFGSEEELNEYAAKMSEVEQKDPKAAKEMRANARMDEAMKASVIKKGKTP